MFRALEENAAIVSAINLKNIEEFSSIKIDEIVFAGGASKGNLWCQILSDVTGYRVKVPKITEATALGAMMAAGVGAGVFSSLQDAAIKLVKWEKEFTPSMTNFKKYKDIQDSWYKIYENYFMYSLSFCFILSSFLFCVIYTPTLYYLSF